MKQRLVQVMSVDDARPFQVRDRARHTRRAVQTPHGQPQLTSSMLEHIEKTASEAMALVDFVRWKIRVAHRLPLVLRGPRIGHARTHDGRRLGRGGSTAQGGWFKMGD